jgi:pimeloyl-ACP methyl ester carboxylesterase
MIEQVVTFGPANNLVGTVTMPENSGSAGLVLFNAGFTARTGPHRINVRLARVLAREGYSSIRFDTSGLGDSARSSTQSSSDAQITGELQQAMSSLQRASGCSKFFLIGLCSGTDPCIRLAGHDDRVRGIILLDPFAYRTAKSRLLGFVRKLQRHVSSGTTFNATKRVLTRLVGTWFRPGHQPAKIRDIWDDLRPKPSRAAFAQELSTALQRNVQILIVHTNHGESIYNYEAQLRDAHPELRDFSNIKVQIFPEANHTYSHLWMQVDLFRSLKEWLAITAPKIPSGDRPA